MKTLYVYCILAIFGIANVYSLSFTISDGDWNTGGTWNAGSTPGYDDVEIRHNVTYPGAWFSVNFPSFIVKAGKTFTVAGDFGFTGNTKPVTLEPGSSLVVVTTSGDGLLISNNASVSVSGNFNATGSLTFNTSTVTIGANFNGGGTIVNLGSTITVSGDMKQGYGTFSNIGNGTLVVKQDIEFTGGAQYSNASGSMINVTGSILSPGNGSITNAGTMSVGQNVELRSGSGFINSGTTNVGGYFKLFSGGNTFNNSNGYINITGVLTSENHTGSSYLNTNGYIHAQEFTLSNSDATDDYARFMAAGGTLPVEMTSLVASQEGDGVLLRWRTLSEVNNECFRVQRSIDGIFFETIGVEVGHGTSSFAHDYSYEDFNVPDASSLVYYRIEQVDVDGATSISHVVFVRMVTDFFSVVVTINNTSFSVPIGATINLLDSKGRTVWCFEACFSHITASVDIAQGVYFVGINSQSTRKIKAILFFS